MKISKNIEEKLSGVPMQKRVFLYDASIIIEFLNATYMPMSYLLTPEAMKRLGADSYIRKSDMKDPSKYGELFVSLYQLYEFYKKFREARSYTFPIESKYKFSIIIKKILLPKNGWQFEVKRVGRAQLIYVGPMELRVKVPLEIRELYPVEVSTPSEVKLSLIDLRGTTLAESNEPKAPDEIIDPTLMT